MPKSSQARLATIVFILFGLFAWGQSEATLISPGQLVSMPPPGPGFSGAILADTTFLPFNMGTGTAGTVREIVVADSLNPFGAGDLTFVLQVSLNVDASINAVSLSNVGLLPLDVSQAAVPQPPFQFGTVPATSANRISPGAIEFVFVPGLTGPPVSARQTSLELLVHTNVHTFSPGTIDVFDTSGASQGLRGFAPTVPEPGTLTLLGLGLAGLAASRRRKQ